MDRSGRSWKRRPALSPACCAAALGQWMHGLSPLVHDSARAPVRRPTSNLSRSSLSTARVRQLMRPVHLPDRASPTSVFAAINVQIQMLPFPNTSRPPPSPKTHDCVLRRSRTEPNNAPVDGAVVASRRVSHTLRKHVQSNSTKSRGLGRRGIVGIKTQPR